MYTVEFNPKSWKENSLKCIHITTVMDTVSYNLSNLFASGDVVNPDWELIGICETMGEALKYAKAFLKRYTAEAKKRKDKST